MAGWGKKFSGWFKNFNQLRADLSAPSGTVAPSETIFGPVLFDHIKGGTTQIISEPPTFQNGAFEANGSYNSLTYAWDKKGPYNGTEFALGLVENSETNIVPRFTQPYRRNNNSGSFPTTMGRGYELSVYIQHDAGRSAVSIGLHGDFGINIDLSSGQVIGRTTDFKARVYNVKITSIANNWFKVSIFFTPIVSENFLYPSFSFGPSFRSNIFGTEIQPYTGDGVSGIRVWNLQISNAIIEDEDTVASTASKTGVAAVNNGAVGLFDSFASSTVVANKLTYTNSGATGPLASPDAYTLTESSGQVLYPNIQIEDYTVAEPGIPTVFDIHVKAIGSRGVNLAINAFSIEDQYFFPNEYLDFYFYSLTGAGNLDEYYNDGTRLTLNSTSIQPVGGGWYQIRLSITPTVRLGLVATVYIIDNTGTGYYTGDGTSGLQIWNPGVHINPLVEADDTVSARMIGTFNRGILGNSAAPQTFDQFVTDTANDVSILVPPESDFPISFTATAGPSPDNLVGFVDGSFGTFPNPVDGINWLAFYTDPLYLDTIQAEINGDEEAYFDLKNLVVNGTVFEQDSAYYDGNGVTYVSWLAPSFVFQNGVTYSIDLVPDNGVMVDNPFLMMGDLSSMTGQSMSSSAAFRFTGVTIPQGAIVSSATMTLVAYNIDGYNGTYWGVFRGDLQANVPLSSMTEPLDNFTLTTASVPAQNSSTNTTALNHNVTAIIQEIINQSGWSSGNALRIVGDPTGADGFAEYIDYSSGVTAYAASLSVTYTTSLGVQEANDTMVATATLGDASITAVVAKTEASDTLSAAATLVPLTAASVAKTEASDTLSSASKVTIRTRGAAATPVYSNIGTRSSSAATTSYTPALPASLGNGNLLIAMVGSKNTLDHTLVSGPGWVKYDQQTYSTAFTVSLWWRVVDGTEVAPEISVGSSVAGFGQIIQYTGQYRTNPFGNKVASVGSGTSQNVSGLTTDSANSRVVYLHAMSANTAVSVSAPFTERFDNGSGTGTTRNSGGDNLYPSAGSNVEAAAISAGSGNWVLWQIELREYYAHNITEANDTLSFSAHTIIHGGAGAGAFGEAWDTAWNGASLYETPDALSSTALIREPVSYLAASVAITEASDTIAPNTPPVIATIDFKNGVYLLNGSTTPLSDIGGSYDGNTFDSGSIVPGTGLVASSTNVNFAFAPGMFAYVSAGFSIEYDFTLSTDGWGLYTEVSSADNESQLYHLAGTYTVAIDDNNSYYDDTLTPLSQGAHRFAVNFSPASLAMAEDGTLSSYSGPIHFPSVLNYTRFSIYPGVTLRSIKIRAPQSAANIQTLSAGGTPVAPNAIVKIKGALAKTETSDSVSAAAQVKVQGAEATTEANDTLTATARVGIRAIVSSSELADSISSTSKLVAKGTGSGTETADTVASTSKILLKAALASTETSDAVVGVSLLKVRATVAQTEASDTLSSAAKLILRGSDTSTEANDGIASTATLKIKGEVGVTEDSDTLSAPTILKVKASETSTEESDTLTSTSKIILRAVCAAAEDSDGASSTAILKVRAVNTATEDSDSLTSSAILKIKALAVVNEGSDSLSATSTIATTTISGTFARTEAPDSLASTSKLIVGASLGVTEAPDVIAANSVIEIKASSALTEDNDSLASSSKLKIRALEATPEASDTVEALAKIFIRASATTTESSDSLTGVTRLKIKGTDTALETDDSVSATAKLIVKGTAAILESPDSLATASKLVGKATGAINEASDALVAASAVKIKASAPFTEGIDALSSTSRIKTHGAVATADESDTLSSASRLKVLATEATTEGSDALSSNAVLKIKASAATTEESDTVIAGTTANIKGAATITEAPDSLSSTYLMRTRAASTATETSDTLLATAGVRIKASSAIVEAADSLTSVSRLQIKAVESSVEANDTVSASAKLKISASATVTEISDSASSDSDLRNKATLTTVETPDTLSSLTKIKVKASAANTEDADALFATSGLKLKATASSTEEPDAIAATSRAKIRASITIGETDDTITASSLIDIRASAAITEESDGATSTSKISIRATVALLESTDDDTLFAFSSSLAGASLFIQEDNDAFSATAKVRLVGQAVVVEAEDTPHFTASIPAKASSTLSEDADTLSSTSILPASATFAGTEDPDAISSSARITIKSVVASTETPDTINAASATTIKGSVSITEDEDTGSETAILKIKGSVGAVEAADALSATSKLLVYASANSVDDDALTASGKLVLRASATMAEAPDTVFASTSMTFAATAILSEDDDGVSATASLKITGTSTTEISDTLSSTARLPIKSAVAIVEESDISIGAAQLGRALATVAITEAPDTLSSNAGIEISGTGQSSEEADSLVASFLLRTRAVAALTDNDNLSATAALHIRSSAALAEAPDTLASTGRLTISAQRAGQEANDAIIAFGKLKIASSVAVIETNDTSSGLASLEIHGSMAGGEASDTVAATSRIRISGSVNRTEAPDTVIASLIVFTTVLEADDTLAASATLRNTGSATIVEAADTLLAPARLPVHAAAALVEGTDRCFASANSPNGGFTNVIENDDEVVSSAKKTLRGFGLKNEADDTVVSTTKLVISARLGTNRDQYFTPVSIFESDDIVASVAHNPINADLISSDVDALQSSARLVTHGFASVTEGNDTLLGKSIHRSTGIGASVEEADSVVAFARVPIRATSSSVQANDTLTATGLLKTHGTLGGLETSDTTHSTAKISIKAWVVNQDGSDILTSKGGLKAKATAVITEQADTITAIGRPVIKSQFTGLDDDMLAATAKARIRGSTIARESDDGVISLAYIKIASRGQTVEQNDLLTSASKLLIKSSGGLVEGDDTSALSGKLISKISGAITEGDDGLISDGDLRIVGNCTFDEENDFLGASAKLYIFAHANLGEGSDTLSARSFKLHPPIIATDVVTVGLGSNKTTLQIDDDQSGGEGLVESEEVALHVETTKAVRQLGTVKSSGISLNGNKSTASLQTVRPADILSTTRK